MDEFLNGWINFFHSGVPQKKNKKNKKDEVNKPWQEEV